MKFVLLCVIVTFVNSGQYILDRKEKIPMLDEPFYVYKKVNKLCPFRYYKRGQLVKKAIPCDGSTISQNHYVRNWTFGMCTFKNLTAGTETEVSVHACETPDYIASYVYVYDKNNSRCQARWQPNEQVNQLNTFTIQECQAEYNLTISPPSKFDALINIAKLWDWLKMDCKLEYQDCTLVNISSVKDIKFLDDDADGIFLGCDTKYNCSRGQYKFNTFCPGNVLQQFMKNVSKTSVAYLKYCYTNTRWIWVEKAVESCSLYENCTEDIGFQADPQNRLSVELVRNISSMKLISCGNESCTALISETNKMNTFCEYRQYTNFLDRPVLTMRYCDRPIEESYYIFGDHDQNCEHIPYGGYCEIMPSRHVAYINNNSTLDIVFRNSTFFKCNFDTFGKAFNCKESVKQISNLFCPKSHALKVGLIPQPKKLHVAVLKGCIDQNKIYLMKTDHLCNKIFDNCLHIFEEEYQLRLQFDEELSFKHYNPSHLFNCDVTGQQCQKNLYNTYCSEEDLERFHNKTNNDVKMVTYTYCDTNQKIYKIVYDCDGHFNCFTQKALEAKSLENSCNNKQPTRPLLTRAKYKNEFMVTLTRQDYARRYNPQYLKCTSRGTPCKKTYETDKPNVFCNGGKAERLTQFILMAKFYTCLIQKPTKDDEFIFRKVDSCKKYEMCQNSKSNDENFIEIHCDDPLEDCSNPDGHGSNIKFNTLCPRELYELLMKNSETDYYLDD